MGASHSQAALPETLSPKLVKHLCGDWYADLAAAAAAAFAAAPSGELSRAAFLALVDAHVVPSSTPCKWDGYPLEPPRATRC